MCDKQEGRPIELKHIGVFYKVKDSDLYTFIPNEELMLDGKLHIANLNNENHNFLPSDVSNPIVVTEL